MVAFPESVFARSWVVGTTGGLAQGASDSAGPAMRTGMSAGAVRRLEQRLVTARPDAAGRPLVVTVGRRDGVLKEGSGPGDGTWRYVE